MNYFLRQISARTVLGQNLDTCTPPRNGVDFTNYTQEKYDAIVKYKTAYYSFCLPVTIAMYMVSQKWLEIHVCIATTRMCLLNNIR